MSNQNMSEQNKAVVRRVVEDIVNGKQLALVDELFSPDYVVHDPSNPNRPGGVAGARGFVAVLHEGFSDLSYSVDNYIAEGDQVTYLWKLRGKHSAPFMGVPPTGRTIEFTGIDIFRLREGKIVESWVVADALSMLVQLGVITLPGPPG